jgi:two-component system chemotaxis response regulator CheB
VSLPGSSDAGDVSGRAGGDAIIRVAVVDDSAVIRGIVTRWLEVDPEIKVVGSYVNGAMAVRQMADVNPDVAILDIEMPEMDGLEALPLLLKAMPDLKVIMSSTLTRRNAEISMRALSMGAADYIPKPESRYSGSDDFKNELIQKVRAHAQRKRQGLSNRSYRGQGQAAPQSPGSSTAPAPAATAAPAQRTSAPAVSARAPAAAPVPGSIWGTKPVVLRAASKQRPTILAIGSSTGGPQALFKVLGELGPSLAVPVVITQHMPATFTAILAEHIQNASKRPTKEAANGDVLQAGHIYVAPGDYHMLVVAEGTQRVIRVNQDPPENFCRPAVDPMFRSIAKIYGAQALGVILTGMGHDGRDGGRVLVDAGGTIICQDEPSSVVWGMPGAAATAGLASQVVPLDQMASTIARALKGGF